MPSTLLPPPRSRVLEGQLAAAYPDATVTRLPAEAFAPASDSVNWSAELRLVPNLFPIYRHPQFDDLLNRNSVDPLAGF